MSRRRSVVVVPTNSHRPSNRRTIIEGGGDWQKRMTTMAAKAAAWPTERASFNLSLIIRVCERATKHILFFVSPAGAFHLFIISSRFKMRVLINPAMVSRIMTFYLPLQSNNNNNKLKVSAHIIRHIFIAFWAVVGSFCSELQSFTPTTSESWPRWPAGRRFVELDELIWSELVQSLWRMIYLLLQVLGETNHYTHEEIYSNFQQSLDMLSFQLDLRHLFSRWLSFNRSRNYNFNHFFASFGFISWTVLGAKMISCSNDRHLRVA